MARTSGERETFESIASRLGVLRCESCASGTERMHVIGYSTFHHVHWRERAVTRRGLYNFLRFVADVAWGLHGRRDVERIWMRNVLACEYGRELGVRFPREWADTDRAHVRSLLVAFGPRMLIDPGTRRRIIRWSR